MVHVICGEVLWPSFFFTPQVTEAPRKRAGTADSIQSAADTSLYVDPSSLWLFFYGNTDIIVLINTLNLMKINYYDMEKGGMFVGLLALSHHSSNVLGSL